MSTVDAVEAEDGRLAASLAATLAPQLRNALDHPLRREVLRILNRSEKPRSIAELRVELPPFRPDQISYHLQVLREAGVVVALHEGEDPPDGRALYSSRVAGDGGVRAVMRATERWDRERREALAADGGSPLLTMFRKPRPVRTIRLRGRGKDNGDQSSE